MKSLIDYDSNRFSGNNLNETLLSCFNLKMNNDDRIIIATAHLPFRVEKSIDNKFNLIITEDSLIYSIMYRMKESEFCDVSWVGMLKNFSEFTEDELDEVSK